MTTHRSWKPGKRVALYMGNQPYPGTLLAPTWDAYAWVLLDVDRTTGQPPRTVRVHQLAELDEGEHRGTDRS